MKKIGTLKNRRVSAKPLSVNNIEKTRGKFLPVRAISSQRVRRDKDDGSRKRRTKHISKEARKYIYAVVKDILTE